MEYAAEDGAYIKAKLKEIEEARVEAMRQSDPGTATGEYLDRLADDYGEKRQGSESDYTFRNRLQRKIKGDAP